MNRLKTLYCRRPLSSVMRHSFLRRAILFATLTSLLRPALCSTAHKFVLLLEGGNSQRALPAAFACGLRRAESRFPGTSVSEAVIFVGVGREGNEEEWSIAEEEAQEAETRDKLCQQLADGGAAFIAILDLTWAGWPTGKKVAVMRGLPYLRVEPTLASFLRAAEAVITTKGASDAALIFTNEDDVDEAIGLMVGRSLIRALVLNRLGKETIRKLKNIRPAPSFNAIFAPSNELEQIFAEASAGGLVTLDDRWILSVTDFNRPRLNTTGHQVTLLSPSKDSCCAFYPEDDCDDGECLGGGRGGRRKEGGGNGMAMEWEVDGECGIHMDSMFVGRMAEMVVGAVISAEAGRVPSSATKTPPVSRPPTQTRDRGNIKDICGGNSDSPPSQPKEFYAAVERVAAASSAVGATETSGEVWTNISSLSLFPRITVDVEVYDVRQYIAPTKVATWRAEGAAGTGDWGESGLTVEPNQVLPKQRHFLRAGIVEMVPWAYWEEGNGMEGGGHWTGYCVDLMKALAEGLEVDYELVPYKGGNFGERQSNGEWNGAIGDLARGDTDLLVASTVMTSEREEVIDFVAPYFEQTGISIVIRKPVRKTSLFKFMTVLRLEVWLSIVGALTVTGIMIWFLDKYSPYSAQNNKKMYPYPCRKFTLKESFWFALTSFTPQGGGEAPKALSSRTLVAAYWLFVVLMLATFTANLAAFLTVERMQSPVQSLEQLARQSRINYTVIQNSTTHQYFINMKNAEDTLYRVWKEITLNGTSDLGRYRVWDYPIKEQYGHILLAIEQTGPVSSDEEGFRKVIESESGEFAFIHDASQVKYETSRNCNLTEVGEPFAEQPFAIAVQTGSHLQEELSRRILDLQKDRFFESLTRKYWNTSSKGDCQNSDDTEGITLESLGGVFIATLFGLALAMVTLAGEILYYRRKRAKVHKMMEMKTLGEEINTNEMKWEKRGWEKVKEEEGRLRSRLFSRLRPKERIGIRQRRRKVVAASFPSVSTIKRASRGTSRAMEEFSHGDNFLNNTRNRQTRVSFEPVFREYDDDIRNRNTFIIDRHIW